MFRKSKEDKKPKVEKEPESDSCYHVIMKCTERKNGTRRVSQSFENVESLTEQSDLPLTSIRALLKRNLLPEYDPEDSVYGDFSSVEDYQSQMERVAKAHDSFESLPAKIRDRFKNDPAKLMDFVFRKENRDEAVALGLIEPPDSPSGDSGSSPKASAPAADDSGSGKTPKESAPVKDK